MTLKKNIGTDLALAVIVIFTAIIFIGFFRVAYPYLDHWENFGEATNLIAAKNFVKFGFLKCYLLPIADPQVESPRSFYTHCPPLLSIFYGLIMRVFNVDNLIIFRMISLLFSALAGWFWYLFLARTTHSFFISLLGLAFYITNPVFILNADGLIHYNLMELFRVLLMFSFVVFLERKNNINLFLLSFLLILNVLNSFEYVIYIFLFMLLYSLFFSKKLGFKYWLVMFMAVCLGFMLHFLQNAVMFGSFKQAFLDLSNSAMQRINSSSELGYMMPNFNSWFHNCFVRNLKLVSFNIFKSVTVLAFLLVFLTKKENINKQQAASMIQGLKLLIILFLCGLSWWILFPSHNIVHIYPATHMLLAASLLDVLIFYFVVYFYNQGLFKINRIIFNIAVSMFVLLFILNNLWKSDLPIKQSNVMSKKLFSNYTQILSEIGSKSENNEYILSNYWNVQVMEYYSGRNCFYITSLEELKKQVLKHRYFLYFPGEGELFNYLKSNYRVVGEYMAQNIPRQSIMPFIIFEKIIK